MSRDTEFETIEFKMCDSCASIVREGYTDNIQDEQQHQARCNHIDKHVLPDGCYWLETMDSLHDDFDQCEGCNVIGVNWTAYAMNSTASGDK